MFTEREATSIARPIAQVTPFAVVLRAARKASGSEKTTPIAVPSVAMWMVSMSGATIFGAYDQRGGHIRSTRSIACSCASRKNSHSMSSADTLQTAAAATAATHSQAITVSRRERRRHTVG